jgi:cysteine-rich repeat protein
MFGGYTESGFTERDSWTLDTSPSLRPAVIFTVDWSQALQLDGDIDRIISFASIGGRGYTATATAVAGAQVLAWDAYAGEWTSWASNSTDRHAPGPLSFTTTTTPEAQRLVDGDGKIHLRFQPAAGIGVADDLGGLSLDYVEVTVHYTIGATDTATCGDSRIDLFLAEVCDDGNILDGDGCSTVCTRETGYSCSGEPSVCVQCGDTFIQGLETCDDGNFINGDGCNEVCQVEYGYTCISPTGTSSCSR